MPKLLAAITAAFLLAHETEQRHATQLPVLRMQHLPLMEAIKTTHSMQPLPEPHCLVNNNLPGPSICPDAKK